MKKLKLFVALSALCAGVQAQPFTGLDTYQHSVPGLLSDGRYTSIHSVGFILAGYQPFTNQGNKNLFIDKVDKDATFTSTSTFANEYIFGAGPAPCGSTINNVSKCYGVSILESNISASVWYALAATFDNGCLFSTLNSGGTPAVSSYFVFPNGVTGRTKPVITESVINPGVFYICGAYQLSNIWRMYALRVNSSGTLGWTRSYDLGASTVELIPTGVVESPYASSPEVVVVGYCNSNANQQREGFYMRLDDANNGAVLQTLTYGSGSGTNEQFLSVAIAADPGANGYIVGGFSDMTTSQGSSWMIKIKPAGGIIWTDLILPSTGVSGAVVSVRERFSSTYSSYEYYGTSDCSLGMSVFKLNNSGALFNQTGNTNNEFIYNDQSGNIATPVTMSYIDNGSVDDGVHIFGTNNNSGAWGDFFMARACFNGAAGNSGCSSPTNIELSALPASNINAGPNNMASVTTGTSGGLRNCTNFTFNKFTVSTTLVNPCDEVNLPTSPYPGNQNRLSGATGISALKNNTGDLSLSPNPVNDKLLISYTSGNGAGILVSISNSVGQLIKAPFNIKTAQGKNEAMVDLGQLNIENGVYFVTIQQNGATTTKKIAYIK